jgi:hypothetical protein
MRELAGAGGPEWALALMLRTQEELAPRVGAVRGFIVTDDGRIRGDPMSTPEKLTEGVAAWLTGVLIAAADTHGVDPAELLTRVTRDSRFVLTEVGFFARLPWVVAF